MRIAAITARKALSLAAGIALATTIAATAQAAPTATTMNPETAKTAVAKQAAAPIPDPPCNRGEVCLYNNGLITKISPVSSGNCFSVNRPYTYIKNLSNIAQRAWTGEVCYGHDILIIPGQSRYVDASLSVGGF